MKVKSLSHVRLLATPWTAAYQAPPSMGFFQARELEWGAIALSDVLAIIVQIKTTIDLFQDAHMSCFYLMAVQ